MDNLMPSRRSAGYTADNLQVLTQSSGGLKFLETHDNGVRKLLKDVLKFREDHPGVIKSVGLRERTTCFITPADESKPLDKLPNSVSDHIQVVKKVCDGNVIAIAFKESSIDINIADE